MPSLKYKLRKALRIWKYDPRKDTVYQSNRLVALIALAAHEEIEAETCPSDEHLAAFIDNRLEPYEHATVLRHLDNCVSCYETWADVTDVMAEMTETVREKPRVEFHWSKIWEPLSQSVAVAAATCLLLFMGFQVPVDMRITQSYQSALTKQMTPTILPWNMPARTHGFASSNRNAPENRAFGAGLWMGKQELAEEKAPMPDFFSPTWDDTAATERWSDTPWSAYFSMGRWAFLIDSICLSGSEASPNFWKAQGEILKRIRKDFAESPKPNKTVTRIVTAKLARLQSVLEGLDEKAPGRSQRRRIVRDVDFITDHLSPKYIPKNIEPK